jgi:hypothetical protein
MLPNSDNSQPGADSTWPPTMFHPHRSTPVPHPFKSRSQAFQEIRNQYIKLMEESVLHANADEEFDWNMKQMSAAELATMGKIYLDMAEWKLSYGLETQGVTRVTPDGAGDSGDEFPGCNSVSEFPVAPKVGILAPIGNGVTMNQDQPDIINPLEDREITKTLDWLMGNSSYLTQADKRLYLIVHKLWRHIQRLDGAWRIQQDRLMELEKRLVEVERWQSSEDSYRLEQNEYEV